MEKLENIFIIDKLEYQSKAHMASNLPPSQMEVEKVKQEQAFSKQKTSD